MNIKINVHYYIWISTEQYVQWTHLPTTLCINLTGQLTVKYAVNAKKIHTSYPSLWLENNIKY